MGLNLLGQAAANIIATICAVKVEQTLRPTLNLIVYHFNCAESVFKSQYTLS